jgi:hypothetical protein
MASIALPLLATNPYTAAFLGVVGAIVDNLIISAITPATVVESGKAKDIDFQTATLGAGIAKCYGTTKVTGNIIWGTKFTEHVHTESSGGKGGGGAKTETKEYSYWLSFAILICEGPITSIEKVYADGNEFNLSDADYTLYKGTEEQEPDDFMESIEGTGKVPAYRGMAYIVFKNFNCTPYGNRIPSFSFIVKNPKNDLKEIVTDIGTDAGLVETLDFNADDLANITIPGFSRSGSQAYKDQINDLRLSNTFDGVEQRGVINFKKRHFDSVIALSKNDYGAYESDPDDEPIQSSIEHDISLPKILNVTYISSDNEYQTGTQPARRQITGATDETTVSTNVVMSDSHAKEVAELRLYESWMARNTHKFKVGPSFGWLLPGYILEVEMPTGNRQLMMVKSTSYGTPGLNEIEAFNVFSGVYSIATRTVDTNPTPIVTVPTEIFYALLDIPKLPLDTSSGDDYMYFVSGAVNYLGANLFRSDDSGASYYLNVQNNLLGIIGTANTVLPDSKTYSWDNANTVDIVINYGTLASHEVSEVLNYANVAILGNEIIQYHYAELIGTNTYRLSGLLRGRFGTEQYTNSHVTGERFVILSTGTISSVPIAKDDWYKSIPVKVGPRPLSVLNSLYKSYTLNSQAVIYKPWAGCHLDVVKDGTTYTASWVRRTRKDGALKDYADAPLNESQELYEVDIRNTAGTVIKTLNLTEPKFTYTGDDVAGFSIYQISDSRGRGWPLEWGN